MDVLVEEHCGPVEGERLHEHARREEQRLAVGLVAVATETEERREVRRVLFRSRWSGHLRDA